MNNLRSTYNVLAAIAGIMVFATMEPLVFITVCCIFILGFLLINNDLIPYFNKKTYSDDQIVRRSLALKRAHMFLSPYKNIWGDLRLSNKHCSLSLDKDGVSIRGEEKVFPYRAFRVISSDVHNYPDLWDMFCVNFSHELTYDGLIEKCGLFAVRVYEHTLSKIDKKALKTSDLNLQKKSKQGNGKNLGILEKPKVLEKLDINNCSEIELTALPGISVVMAKKAIKKREEIKGFKSIEDFFLYMRLKPHMESQLRERICVKKMKGSLNKIERSSERSVDI